MSGCPLPTHFLRWREVGTEPDQFDVRFVLDGLSNYSIGPVKWYLPVYVW